MNLSGSGTKVFIETFGCTANAGDTMKLRAILRKSGHKIVMEEREADVVIVNTCTVTKRTELNVLKRLEALKGQGKEVVVAGCMAAAQPELVRSILGRDTALVTPQDIYNSKEQEFEFDGVICIIPISIGCVGNCSYCIVKRARGKLTSYEPEQICEAVKSAVDRGAKEIRFTAQDCSAYGLDSQGIQLPELLKMISAVRGEFRVRVGMMNPFTLLPVLDDLLDAFESEKVFKFFHVPVQSGSDRVLNDMCRAYKVDEFVDIVTGIRNRFDNCTISTDFIIGFPTETDCDFLLSLNLLAEVRPEKVNITRFSPRPMTEATKQKDLLEREKKRRSRIISAVYHQLALAANRELEGTVVHVLTTEQGKKGGVIARDCAYHMVVLKEDLPPGVTYDVRIKEAKSSYLVGEVKHF